MTVINTNISALTAEQGQRTSQMGLAMAMKRLSTRQRINSAKDDAAGLAISQRMTDPTLVTTDRVQTAYVTVSLTSSKGINVKAGTMAFGAASNFTRLGFEEIK
jgi:flagellin